jgi:pimeloyl-ACP methyl ester carboxylesterase
MADGADHVMPISANAPEATPIILLPGMDGTGEFLTALANQLSADRTVQLLTYPLDRPLGYAQLVAYVLERAPKGPFVILGESYSGPIAIEIAATDPRVVGLVLASSFVRHPWPAQFAMLTRLLDLRWVPTSIIVTALAGSTATPKLRARLRRTLARLPRETVRARACEVLRVDRREQLREIKCPTLCLHGRLDCLVGRKCVDEIVAAQPRCQVHWFDASHMLLATHTEASAKAINHFCDHLND